MLIITITFPLTIILEFKFAERNFLNLCMWIVCNVDAYITLTHMPITSRVSNWCIIWDDIRLFRNEMFALIAYKSTNDCIFRYICVSSQILAAVKCEFYTNTYSFDHKYTFFFHESDLKSVRCANGCEGNYIAIMCRRKLTDADFSSTIFFPFFLLKKNVFSCFFSTIDMKYVRNVTAQQS